MSGSQSSSIVNINWMSNNGRVLSKDQSDHHVEESQKDGSKRLEESNDSQSEMQAEPLTLEGQYENLPF